jgi:metal-dependent amidase/aminoacylase/carboxypeptidase family protein
MSIIQQHVIFHGQTSHAAAAWMSQSHALDAGILYCQAIEFLREQSQPQFRFHYVIKDGGVAANVVPDKCEIQSWVRHFIDETKEGNVSPGKARELIEDKAKRMIQIADGIAMATNTKAEVHQYGQYIPGISVQRYYDTALYYAIQYGGRNIEYKAVPEGFEETGNLDQQVSGITIAVGNPDLPEVPGHSQQNADLSITPEGHENLAQTAKAMAATLLRLAMDQELAEKIKADHARLVEEYNK